MESVLGEKPVTTSNSTDWWRRKTNVFRLSAKATGAANVQTVVHLIEARLGELESKPRLPPALLISPPGYAGIIKSDAIKIGTGAADLNEGVHLFVATFDDIREMIHRGVVLVSTKQTRLVLVADEKLDEHSLRYLESVTPWSMHVLYPNVLTSAAVPNISPSSLQAAIQRGPQSKKSRWIAPLAASLVMLISAVAVLGLNMAHKRSVPDLVMADAPTAPVSPSQPSTKMDTPTESSSPPQMEVICMMGEAASATECVPFQVHSAPAELNEARMAIQSADYECSNVEKYMVRFTGKATFVAITKVICPEGDYQTLVLSNGRNFTKRWDGVLMGAAAD